MTSRHLLQIAAAMAALALAACGKPEAPAAEHADEKPGAHAGERGEGHGDEHGEEGALKLSGEDAQRAGIKLEALAAQALADTVTVTATIHANADRLARIAPRVDGRVVSVSARLGDRVRAGQALATLDSPAIGEAAMALTQAEAEHRVAATDAQRAEALNAEEVIPKKDWLRARSELDKASANLRTAQDRLRLLGASPRHGTSGIASTFSVAAPFAGTVIEKAATTGQLATPGDALFVVADLSRVWIEADLAEGLLAKVRPGAQASVTVEAYPGVRFAGKLTYLAAVLDESKRTVPARIEVDNADGRLKPGMFATATIASATDAPAAQALTVPDDAIVLMQGQPTVFVFEKEHGAYEPRPVEPGARLAGRTVVKAGLAAGDQVVVAGAYALKARQLKSQLGHGH